MIRFGRGAAPVSVLLLAAAVSGAFAAPAKARALRCWFNEPSLTTDYRPDRRLFVVTDPVTAYPAVRRHFFRHVRRIDRPGGRIELRSGSVVLAHMVRNGQGSDGMSDRRYPYAVAAAPSGPRRDGGCDWVDARRPFGITKP